jgi:hypothetical protein
MTNELSSFDEFNGIKDPTNQRGGGCGGGSGRGGDQMLQYTCSVPVQTGAIWR